MTPYRINHPQQMNGLDLLAALPTASTPLVFFDPQYRGVLDHLEYGGVTRQVSRHELAQMDAQTIRDFVSGIARVLTPSGHLMLWLDKFSVMENLPAFTGHEAELMRVDMITWDKQRIGMGYRTRRACEYLVILQKSPRRARGVWNDHSLPDVWSERITVRDHAHNKPVGLQQRIIEAVTAPGDMVIDPAAGSYSVFEAAAACGRNFIGCDLRPHAQTLPMQFEAVRS